MDGLAILQLLITYFVIYVVFVVGKLLKKVLSGEMKEASIENAFLLFCIVALLAIMSIVGTINTLVEYWQRAP